MFNKCCIFSVKFLIKIKYMSILMSTTSIFMSEEVKIVVIGDTGVGKTSITSRLISNTFCSNSPSTLSASFLRKNIDG